MRGWLWIPALIGAALVIALLDGDSGLGTWLRLRADLGAARSRIGEIRREIALIDREAEGLESDDYAIERAIREELEYARRGETVVRLPPGDHASPRFP